MANYQRCKIRLYPHNQQINLEEIQSNIERLKKANNIYETIEVYHPDNFKFVEMHFTARRFPHMLSDIFPLDAYDIWGIASDEGGSSDYLFLDTENIDDIGEFGEKAIYLMDEIRVYGDQEDILNHLQDLFGYGLNHIQKEKLGNGIKVHLQGQYTANNFFYNEDEGKILIRSFDEEPQGVLRNETGEFWDMLFHQDQVQFKSKFYTATYQLTGDKKEFPYVSKIEFFYKNRLSNRIVRDDDKKSEYWQHFSDDGFWNCGNARFFAYELFRN